MRLRPNRPFRRRGLRRGLIATALMGRIAEANRLFDSQQPGQAALAFADLGREAEAHGHPPRAAQFHLRASESYLLVGDGDAAYEQARAALAILKEQGRPGRARRAGERFAQALQAAGFHAQAEALQRELSGLPASVDPEPMDTPTRGRLPTHCPKCGGPARSDEVEWIDEHSAECAYCGSPLRAAD